MENLKKSKRVALDIIEDAKEVIAVETVKVVIDGAVPGTSKETARRTKEVVKYDKITFNTTAVLHHYPQISENETKKALKKSDLNVPLPLAIENNNGIKDIKVSRKDKVNNNKIKIIEEDKIEVMNEPLKFAEEKLV